MHLVFHMFALARNEMFEGRKSPDYRLISFQIIEIFHLSTEKNSLAKKYDKL